MFAHRNNDHSHQPNQVIITTGLSSSLEPFELRIFFLKSSGGLSFDWRWETSHGSCVVIEDLKDFCPDGHRSIINLSGSDKWYEADTYEKGLLLRGNGKFGPHETEENARRRLHGGD
jgi:hypothetical protein